jgi:hypothetical protein
MRSLTCVSGQSTVTAVSMRALRLVQLLQDSGNYSSACRTTRRMTPTDMTLTLDAESEVWLANRSYRLCTEPGA